MLNTTKLLLLVAIAGAVVVTSCKKPEQEPLKEDTFTGAEKGSLFVANEGTFGSGNGSLSYINHDDNTISNNVYAENNAGATLGDVVQSVYVYDDRAFVVVNNSGIIKVIDTETFESVRTINGINSPRFITSIGNKGYISDWTANAVYPIDMDTYATGSGIPTGTGPETMVSLGVKLYVANVGGFGDDNTITVINTTTETVENTVTVGDKPNSMVFDKEGKLWVLCGGSYGDFVTPSTFTPGELMRLVPTSGFNELFRDTVGVIGDHPYGLCRNSSGDKVYYNNGNGIYEMGIEDAELPTTPLIAGNFYGLAFDNNSKHIFVTDAKDFVSAGTISEYDTDGTFVRTYNAGVVPNGNFGFMK